ncbi:MAG: cysteine--tRNA ligase [Candidatus Levybacteria bacterium CG10_big_fil_rev_8_21_14_0_10_36_30]|nr:MAG: cysteine--tRNA ligase [Candidatus Levybacteria bacterium CG10_big_fil_rev_8_21_14_0_10_36_30]
MKLYNTLSRTIEEFVPLNDKKVNMYTCGPTVYREIHIGNLRTYITSDILVRTLKAQGYDVTSVMNITDVGHFRFSSDINKVIDPVMQEAKETGKSPLEISRKYTDIFLKDAKKVGIIPADFYPRATDHIGDMIELIEVLLEKGFAYIAEGNVYFDVKKFKDYGKLSGNTLDKMESLMEAVRVSVETDKNDSADFALWKKAEPDRVMKWDSPWGQGVPGWHIECSAMAQKTLQTLTLDIHTGGEDLIFPHHEDEIAQSEAASGQPFVKHWTHTNFLLVDSEKMSRSKRYVYTVEDLEKKKFSPLAFRYLTFMTHYRSKMNFTWEGLEAAQSALDKLYETAASLPNPQGGVLKFEAKFEDALNNDLNMPQAVSVLWEMVRSKNPKGQIAASLYKMDEVLGLSIKDKALELVNIPQGVLEMVSERVKLRRDRKYNAADLIRAKIERMGYVLEDTKDSSRILRKI